MREVVDPGPCLAGVHARVRYRIRFPAPSSRV